MEDPDEIRSAEPVENDSNDPPTSLRNEDAEQPTRTDSNHRSSNVNIFQRITNIFHDVNHWPKEWRHLSYLVNGLIFVIILFFAVLIIDGIYTGLHGDVETSHYCHSSSCNSTADFMKQSMDLTVNPCENFYDFVCGKVNKNYTSKATMIRSKIASFLENEIIFRSFDKKQEYSQKLQDYYDSCVHDEGSTDRDSKEDLVMIFNQIGGWPILDENKTREEDELDWVKVIHGFRREGLPFDYFLKFSININFKDNTKRIIQLNQPSLGIDREYLIEGLDNPTVQNYKNFIVNITKWMGAKDDVEQQIEDLLKFEIELAKISEPLEELGAYWDAYYAKSVGHLESNYPGVKWIDYINGILSPYKKVNASEIVHLAIPSYFKKFSDLMSERKPPNRVLVNYAFWRATLSLIDYLGEPILEAYNTTELKRRPFYINRINKCVTEASSNLYLATSSLYLQEYVKKNFSDNELKLTSVRLLSENIENTLYMMIKKVDGLKREMRGEILEKISNITALIGYPKELLNETKLNDYYQDLKISNESFLVNKLNYNRFKLNKDIESLLKPYNKSEWTEVFGRVVSEKPSYLPQNVLYVPQATLHDKIYFDKTFPAYMNYAMLGFMVAHEISHAFTMRFFDKFGQLQSNASNLSRSDKYLKKIQCFVKQYNNYANKDFHLKVNGTQTVIKNMADVIALKIAYHAYYNIVKNRPIEIVLETFPDFTERQMFWITFGTSMCREDQISETDIRNTILKNSYAPSRYRLINSVSNLWEFSYDFKCKPRDAMHRLKKCTMW